MYKFVNKIWNKLDIRVYEEFLWHFKVTNTLHVVFIFLFRVFWITVAELSGGLSRPDLSSFLCLYFWFGQGVSWGGHSMFLFYVLYFCVWPGMVPNQRQLSIVVSDWESYLGSLFPPVFVGSCFLFLCLHQTERFRLFSLLFCYSVFSSTNKRWTRTTLHLGPHLLPPAVTGCFLISAAAASALLSIPICWLTVLLCT